MKRSERLMRNTILVLAGLMVLHRGRQSALCRR